MLKKARRLLRDLLLPHKGNQYKPLIFTAGSVAVILLGLVFLEALYLVDTRIVFEQPSMTASVLPAVLADLTNEDRAAEGLAPVTFDATLAAAAEQKAQDMAAKGYFAHVSPDGKSPWYWLDQVGYDYQYAGENLAVNFTDSKEVEEAWMNSPAHRANIVKSAYTKVGIGVAKGTYEGRDALFVVQFFATPAATKLAAAPVKTLSPRTLPAAEAVATGTPSGAPAEATTTLATASSAPSAVLGVETASPTPSLFAQIAASPVSAYVYLLTLLSIVFALLLALAIFVHARMQYLEVMSGGLAILMAAVVLLVFTASSGPGVRVPEGAQPAAAIEALP